MPLSAQNYIGTAKCATCHPFEYEVWKNGPHAKAHESLSAQQLADPKCNTCHTTAPGLTDGGVQCERCHGPGLYYHFSYVMKDRELARAVGLVDSNEAQCRQCHTDGAPSIAPFDFMAKWARIDHGKAARQIWEQARSGASGVSKSDR